MTLNIPDEPSKPFQLWRVDGDGNQIERVGEYDTLEEMRAVPRRLDWYYAEYRGTTRVDGSPR